MSIEGQTIPPGLAQAQQKMRSEGVNSTAIDVFGHYYAQLQQGATGRIPEDSIDPLTDPPALADVQIDGTAARAALAKTAMIKLNGGLGTSMGMSKAKSLVPVREGKSFLDIDVRQVLAARRRHGVRLPLVLMNSFNTSQDTLAALAAYPELAVADLPLEFMQSQAPKLLVDGLTPASWPQEPSLEWCPPGHGDIYPSLLASGVLDALLDAGFEYASVSNSDNLGASPNATLAGWFAASGAPYAAEVCRRTAMDRKGGHLAVRKSDGRLILRETAQTSAEEMHYFTDEHRHPYFHTNNLWFNLRTLREVLGERGGVLGLPMILNAKTLDPRDPQSPPVYQIETAMGAAVEVFPGAQAIAVPRGRFRPVKTTNDLLLLRSDVYDLDADDLIVQQVDEAPVISLGPAYRTIDDFEARFPQGAPSLLKAGSLTVDGDWTFEPGTVVEGNVHLPDEGVRTVGGRLHG
ncbi:MAG: UTP--glucose-1-phosphate uridylyltransferase [Actinomycetales bacterium]